MVTLTFDPQSGPRRAGSKPSRCKRQERKQRARRPREAHCERLLRDASVRRGPHRLRVATCRQPSGRRCEARLETMMLARDESQMRHVTQRRSVANQPEVAKIDPSLRVFPQTGLQFLLERLEVRLEGQ